MSKKDLEGVALGIIVISIIVGLFLFAEYRRRQSERVDLVTLCPREGVEAATVIIIDKTDPYDRHQVEAIKRRILKARDELRVLEQISIHVLDSGGIRPVLTLCNPGKGDSVNPIYQNPKLAQEKYEESFLAPFDAKLAKLIEPDRNDYSPIARAISRSITLDPRVLAAKSKKLIIFTDLLENDGEDSSIYRGTLTTRKISDRIASDAKFWLGNAAIEIKLILRDPRPMQKKATAMWEEYLRSVPAKYTISDF